MWEGTPERRGTQVIITMAGGGFMRMKADQRIKTGTSGLEQCRGNLDRSMTRILVVIIICVSRSLMGRLIKRLLENPLLTLQKGKECVVDLAGGFSFPDRRKISLFSFSFIFSRQSESRAEIPRSEAKDHRSRGRGR